MVGAGISGAMIAQVPYGSWKASFDLDRRRAAFLGSTAASTALLQFELDMPLTKLSASIGRRKAERVWIASRNAVNELRTRSHRLGIDAHFKTRPSLYLSGNVLDAQGLKREVAQRQRIGLASEYLDRKDLRHHFGIDRPAALLNHGNAEANPVELAAGYLRLAIRAGAQFHAPHDVVDIECDRRGTMLLTNDGIHIHRSARRLLHRLRTHKNCAGDERYDRIDVGDCHTAAAAGHLAAKSTHMGGFGAVSLHACNLRRPSHLRR